MRINHFVYRSFAALLLVCAFGLFYSADAQTSQPAPVQQPTPTVIVPVQKGPLPVTGNTNLYCAGFIQIAPEPNNLQIVGGEEEQEQNTYAQGDYVYINAGAQQSVRVGQEYIVVRPRGRFKTRLTKKKGSLGVFTQELGALRVVEVKDLVSLAIVTRTCDTILMGDLLRPEPQRVAPLTRQEEKLDRFADPSGKQRGRIVLARDSREALSRDQIVFIDLGAEDNVKVGDYLTISRPLGKGNISRFHDEEISTANQEGFQSNIFRGGKFSNKAQRVKDPNKTEIYTPTIVTPDVIAARPPMPRKIVGEMVILSVQQRTATAVITRVAQEVHTGDDVEVQ